MHKETTDGAKEETETNNIKQNKQSNNNDNNDNQNNRLIQSL